MVNSSVIPVFSSHPFILLCPVANAPIIIAIIIAIITIYAAFRSSTSVLTLLSLRKESCDVLVSIILRINCTSVATTGARNWEDIESVANYSQSLRVMTNLVVCAWTVQVHYMNDALHQAPREHLFFLFLTAA